jgi:ABC-type glutathione transport system ATPase component
MYSVSKLVCSTIIVYVWLYFSIDINIPEGSLVAIVGRVGSGKSFVKHTLLIPKIYNVFLKCVSQNKNG